jgi:broad specificity phosphatase PhoE
MTTTLLDVRDSLKNSYYQRDWVKALPSLPEGWMATGQHIGGLALPLVGILYQPAGRAISYTSTILNSLSSLAQIFSSKSLKRHVWSLVKNGSELVGTLAGLRIGLAVHTMMNFGENLLSLRNFQMLTWSQVGEKMVPVVSNGLYLATLYNFSKKVSYAVMGASLLFQASLSAYKTQQNGRAIKSWKDIKVLDTATHAALTAIFFIKAHTCYQQFMKIHQAVQKTFVLMRPASKHDKVHGGISEKGKKLAETKLPVALEELCKRYGKDGVIIITSTDKHHHETGKTVAEKLGLDPSQVITDPNMRERTKTGWLLIGDKKVRRADPDYIHFNKKLSEEEQWITPPDPKDARSESQAALAARLSGALETHLSTTDNTKLPVFVSGGTIIQDYVRSLLKSNPALPQEAAKRFKDGDMLVIQMTPDENGDLKVSLLERVVRRQPTPEAQAPAKTDALTPPPESPSGQTKKAASASDPGMNEKAFQEMIRMDEQKAQKTFLSFRDQFRQAKLPQQSDDSILAEAMAQLAVGPNISLFKNLEKIAN